VLRGERGTEEEGEKKREKKKRSKKKKKSETPRPRGQHHRCCRFSPPFLGKKESKLPPLFFSHRNSKLFYCFDPSLPYLDETLSKSSTARAQEGEEKSILRHRGERAREWGRMGKREKKGSDLRVCSL
jgi:hypothetical protein